MLNKLPKDIIKDIKDFVEPTEEQLEYWKMCHYINYYKVLHDVRDTIIEIKIGKNAKMKCVFSLFSMSLIDTDYYFDNEEDEIIEFYNYNYGFDYLEESITDD